MIRRAQSTIEAAGVLPILFTAIIGMAAFLAFVGQGWALGQLSAYVGTTLISTGKLDFDGDGTLQGADNTADYEAFMSKAALLNSSFDVEKDTLTISVLHVVEGVVPAPEVEVFGLGGSASLPELDIAYGDLVTVTMSRTFAFTGIDPENDLFGLLAKLATTSASWSGVAQRDTLATPAPGGGSSNKGYVLVTVTGSGASPSPIPSASVSVGSPVEDSGETDANGKITLEAAAGEVPVTVSATGYQTYTNYVTVYAGILTNVGVVLSNGVDIFAKVLYDDPALSNTNGDFETTSGWSSAANIFVAPLPSPGLSYVADPHGGTYAGSFSTDATASEGIYKALPGTYASGTVYVAEVYVKSDGAPNAPVALIVGSPSAVDFEYETATVGTTWTKLRLSWTPTGNRTDVMVAIRGNNGANTPVTVYVDDFSITTAAALQEFCNVTTADGLTSSSTENDYQLSVTNNATYSLTATCPIIPPDTAEEDMPTTKEDAWLMSIGTRSSAATEVIVNNDTVVDGKVYKNLTVE